MKMLPRAAGWLLALLACLIAFASPAIAQDPYATGRPLAAASNGSEYVDFRQGGQAVTAKLSAIANSVPAPVAIVVGDSITNPDYNNANQVTPSTTANHNKGVNGYMTWALALAGQRVQLPEANIHSFPGMETSTILADLPSLLAAAKPALCVLQSGTNNVLHDPTGADVGSFASITADWKAQASLCRQAGARVIFVPILPRDPSVSGGTAYTAAQYDVVERANRWLVDYAQASGGYVAVAALPPTIFNPAAEGGKWAVTPIANSLANDGTHPGTAAYYVGKAVAAPIIQWYPLIDRLPANNLRWSASSPRANLLTNGMLLTGTSYGAGTVTAPAAGVAPDGWTLSQSQSGPICTGSLVTSTITSEPMVQIALSGSYTLTGTNYATASYPFCRLFQQLGSAQTASIAIGDTVEAEVRFEVDAGSTGIMSPSLQMRWGNSSGFHTAMQPGLFAQLPAESMSGVLRTFRYTFTGTPAVGDVGVFLFVYLRGFPDGTVSPSGNVRFGRVILRKVDPAS